MGLQTHAQEKLSLILTFFLRLVVILTQLLDLLYHFTFFFLLLIKFDKRAICIEIAARPIEP